MKKQLYSTIIALLCILFVRNVSAQKTANHISQLGLNFNNTLIR